MLIIGIAFLSNAGPSRAEKSHSEKHAVLHIGQSWSEFNRFQLKVNSVAMKHGEDGQRLCDVMFHVENWLPLLQQGENTISVQLTATAEHGKESIEVKMLNGNNITVAADENKGTSCTMTLPEKTERVLLKFSVIPEHDEKIYQRHFALILQMFHVKHLQFSCLLDVTRVKPSIHLTINRSRNIAPQVSIKVIVLSLSKLFNALVTAFWQWGHIMPSIFIVFFIVQTPFCFIFANVSRETLTSDKVEAGGSSDYRRKNLCAQSGNPAVRHCTAKKRCA